MHVSQEEVSPCPAEPGVLSLPLFPGQRTRRLGKGLVLYLESVVELSSGQTGVVSACK